MGSRRLLAFLAVAVLLVATPVLAACESTPTPTAVPTQAPQPTTVPPTTAPTAVPPTAVPTKAPTAVPTKAPPTNTPVPAPAVGGTFVWAGTQDPPTLDPQKVTWDAHAAYTGAALIAWGPDAKFYPWLAESWTVSADGLTYAFKLRKDVKFSTGAPLKASDWIYTIQRAQDPAIKSPVAATMWGQITKTSAPDDYTLVLGLDKPYAPLMLNLSLCGFTQPLSKAAVDQYGDNYGRHPVGVGPYIFKEWQSGNKIVWERNPDYVWQPAYAKNKGPYYIQTVEYHIIPEEATILAALESGEVDYYNIQPKDVARIKATGKFQILEGLVSGMDPSLSFNNSKPPFDDVRVRQAFYWAVDRATLGKTIVGDGNSVPQCGALSVPVLGYSAALDTAGCKQDIAKAKDLMQQAGYTLGANGMFQKDGKPFQVPILVVGETWAKVAQVLQEQYKAAGLDIQIQMAEVGVYQKGLFGGDYQLAMVNWGYPDGEILYLILHSSGADGGLNVYKVKDPALDALLEASRTTVDPAKRLDVFAQIQKLIFDKAYLVPLYTPKIFTALSTKIKGAYLSPVNSTLYREDAYITTK